LNHDEVEAVAHLSPSLAPYIVLAVPVLGVLAFYLQWLPRLPIVRSLVQRLTGWDPGAVPEDETSRRTMQLVDQLQEELTRVRTLVDRYGGEIEQLRLMQLALRGRVQELRDAAIAGRTLAHQLQRQLGIAETPFDPLPGDVTGERTMAS